MSRYGWLPAHIEQEINRAVVCRIERWSVKWSKMVHPNHPVTDKEKNAAVEVERRRLKYTASARIRAALCYAHHVATSTPSVEWPVFRKRILKEIARRYQVVDRAYGATIMRKNGRMDRISL